MRRTVAVLAVSFACTALALAQTAPELFMKAKEQVKAGSWQEALKTLDALEAEANKPGNEGMKQQLAAPLSFYRGVCEANLDQADKARADFATFLKEKPGSSIDKGMYSKKAVAAFEAAGKDAAPAASGSDNSPSLFQRFQEFKAPPNMGEKPDAAWADGPAKWIMTSDEKAAWASLAGDAERAEFVEKFWEKRNPRPGSEDNTARTGFDRRVAFADAAFRLDEKQRGSLTDRGMVFVLLGPPTWAGRKPLQTGDDASEQSGMTGPDTLARPGKLGTSGFSSVQGPSVTDSSADFREIWHYRKELLPKGVSYLQVDFEFITRKGYGRYVLQRESAPQATLDAAEDAASPRPQ